MIKKLLTLILVSVSIFQIQAQTNYSVARRWNEVQLAAIRQDFARPPIQARNLYHVSLAMYDAWAAYSNIASTVVLGKTINGVNYPFSGIVMPSNIDSARDMAISYAAYRVLLKKYVFSNNFLAAKYRFDTLMSHLGYDIYYTNTDYVNGTPADLGNYIAEQVIAFGLADGSNESVNYANQFYVPSNAPLEVAKTGNPTMTDPNKWQQLTVVAALDQNGNPIPSTPAFICPEWGNVIPFALDPTAATHYNRNGHDYTVYHDPGAPPTLDTVDVNNPSSLLYKWGHTMVAAWSCHLDPDDTTTMDISPASRGNISSYPTTFNDAVSFYNFTNGGSNGTGYSINPATNAPYTPQIVKRGDYTRVLSQFWADGPASETPPGHWYTILNHVSDYTGPDFSKRFEGVGPILSDLEWDIKSYLTLGGAVHDAAIACWGIKGWYDSPRPISAIRKMAMYGQCSDSTLPHYHPGGLPLTPGFIELVTVGDSLAGVGDSNINKIKIKSWKGFKYIANPATDHAGVGWILAEDWMPYQRKTFVTPPFAGYVSGHSTYSRAGAYVMTLLTGNPYFPGGMAEFPVSAYSGYLVFENGPTTDIHLQWAKYVDASDEASLSRIWGSIHPPFDDFNGRHIGEMVGTNSFNKAKSLFTGLSLPTTFNSFNGVIKDCHNQLSWATASERNVQSFLVMRSADGLHFTEKIAEVKATGNSEVKKQYSFIDKKPLPLNFYKIVAVDVDQSQMQSDIVKLDLKSCFSRDEIVLGEIYPNPAIDEMNIDLISETKQGDVTIHLIDLTGRQLMNLTQTMQSGKNSIHLNIKEIPAGHYILQLDNLNGVKEIRKFSKL